MYKRAMCIDSGIKEADEEGIVSSACELHRPDLYSSLRGHYARDILSDPKKRYPRFNFAITSA